MSEGNNDGKFKGKSIGELYRAWRQEAKDQEEFDRRPDQPCRTFDDLSPRAKRIVKRLAGATPRPANRDHYDLAKVAISLCCGWDEPRGKGGHNQYKVAIDAYVEAVEL